MAIRFVNERSSRRLTGTFFDDDDAPATPSGVTYRIDCLSSGTEILGDTSVAAAAKVVINITSDQNRIINPDHSREKRRITVVASYIDGDEADYFDYWIKNLSGV